MFNKKEKELNEMILNPMINRTLDFWPPSNSKLQFWYSEISDSSVSSCKSSKMNFNELLNSAKKSTPIKEKKRSSGKAKTHKAWYIEGIGA